MANVTKTLSAAEIATFERLETTIAQGKKTFIEVGKALLQIQTFKLYRKDYDTWEVYCQKRWGFTGRRGNQLINSTVALEPLTKDLGSMFPISERAAKEVIKVPEAKRLKVIKEAASNGLLSARSIKEAASKIEPKPEPETPKDEMGFPLPKVSIPFWGRRQEIQELMTKVSQVRSSLKQYQDGEDVWLRDLYNALAQDLDSIYLTISDRKPFAVCPYCEGSLTYKNEYGKRDCKACNHIGLVSKAIFDKAPLDLKAKRAEALK